MKPESEVLTEIDRQVQSVAEALHVRAHARLRAVGAPGARAPRRRATATRCSRAASTGSSRRSRAAWSTSAGSTTRPPCAPRRAPSSPRRARSLDSRLAFAREQLEELQALQGKNQKLVEALARKAGVERGAPRAGARDDDGAAHGAQPARRRAGPAARPERGARGRHRTARMAVRAARSRAGSARPWTASSARCASACAGRSRSIDEARTLMGNVSRKFAQDYQIATVEAPGLRHRALPRRARPPRGALRARLQGHLEPARCAGARRSARSSSTPSRSR